jgi:hypothetical protein
MCADHIVKRDVLHRTWKCVDVVIVSGGGAFAGATGRSRAKGIGGEECGTPVVDFEFGLDRECGSLEFTSEAAERVTLSDDDVDREGGSLEGSSEVAERGPRVNFSTKVR